MGNLNINQFALPGMERLAHPGAGHLAKGYSFEYEYEPSYDEHSLNVYGHDPHRPWVQRDKAELVWGGRRDRHAPGEIKMVSSYERSKGHATTLFKMAHDPNLGIAETVPVHSWNRTDEGERWANRVGPAHLLPKKGDIEWEAPPGTHPFQREEEARWEAGHKEKLSRWQFRDSHLKLPGID